MFKIRLMQHTDLPAVVRLQDSCYSEEFFEPAAVVHQRLMLYPQSCWVACYQDKLWGYLFSYPALTGQVNPLGAGFGRYDDADALYLHDMAVSMDARGQGVASALLATAKAYTTQLGLSRMALVAVQQSASYWQQHGFVVCTQLSADALSNLHTYGEQALYLTLDLLSLSS